MIERELKALWKEAGRGDVESLKARVLVLAEKPLSRAQRLRLATLCNDILLADVAFRLLYRQVRAEIKPKAATDQERMQYARAMVMKDLVPEGIAILKTIDAKKNPMASYYLARAYARVWNYEAMVPLLQAGLAHPRIDGRRRLNHMYYLANALFTARGERVEPQRLLEEAVGEAKRQELWDAQIWATEMIVAHQLWDHDWDAARASLAELARLFKDYAGGRHELVHEKWLVVLSLNADADKTQALAALTALEAKFAALGMHAQGRNLDYYRALCFKDRALAARLYFGSPHAHFRERVLRDVGLEKSDLPAHLDFVVAEGEAPVVLDVFDGASTVSEARLKRGQALQRLLAALVSDAYVPPNVYELHTRLFGDSYFNPVSSPLLIHRHIHRLRAWLDDNGIPLRIEERGGRYVLASDVAFVVRVRAPWAQLDADQTLPLEFQRHLTRVEQLFPAQAISAAQIESCLGVSRSTVLSLIRASKALKRVEKSGSGTATRYRFKAA